MPKDRSFYTDANRDAWNETAPRHARANQERLLSDFAQPGHVDLGDHLIRALQTVGVSGKSVVQLCCNNGKDLLSVKNMGAGSCVGVDGSAPFIEQACEIARVAGHTDTVRFIASDIYALPDEFDGRFDITLVTIGVLSWLPDLKGFFDRACNTIKPGGHLVIEEMHPVLFMYEPGTDGQPSELTYSYFNKEPFVEQDGLDYYTGETYDSKPMYSFQHKLDDIIMTGIACGLNLRHFEELPYDISLFCADLENAVAKPPLGFTMVWEKTALPG